MKISFHGGEGVFRTPFDDKFDLTQIFRGLGEARALDFNGPVDFRAAGLVRRECRDIWHLDRVLALSTDEVPPLMFRGMDAGGNHSFTAATRLTLPGHGLGLADVGTLFRDDEGRRWTLIRVEDDAHVLFVSDDSTLAVCRELGPSRMLRRVASAGEGLRELVLPTDSGSRVDLKRAIRCLERSVWCEQNGSLVRITDDAEGERAEIREVYEIVDPAAVGPALRALRPAGGFLTAPDLAVGEPVATVHNTYEIQNDGTVLTRIRIELREDAPLDWVMGMMYQEKCEQGGGNLRLIPGLRAVPGFEYLAGPFDTSFGPYPAEKLHLTREFWADPDDPPCRQIDLLREYDGTPLAAFAAGYLPLGDGAPAVRAQNIHEAWNIVPSRKTYPTLYGTYDYDVAKSFVRAGRPIDAVCYRKYFRLGADGVSRYEIRCDGEAYRFEDKML